MTHAECQDLLLDLAYGELDSARAAQVEEHAHGCAQCGPELAQLLRTRNLVAPLSQVEEPRAGFDAKVLEAARAEAVLLSDGLPGQVVEAEAREQRPAVEAVQVDARARVRRPKALQTRRRAWMVRAAVAGSVAAVAGLALVVSGGLDKPAPRTDDASYRIQIHAPGAQPEAQPAASPATPPAAPKEAAPAPKAKTTAQAPAAEAPAPETSRAQGAAAAPAAGAPGAAAAQLDKYAQPAQDRARAAEGASRERAAAELSRARAGAAGAAGTPGGASADALGASAAGARVEAKKHKVARADDAALGSAEPAAEPAEPAHTPARAQPHQEREAPPQAQAQAKGTGAPAPALRGETANAASPAPAAPASATAAEEATKPAGDPASLEQRAESARRRGAYAAAAPLYREASRLRTAAGDESAAGWDLAHAVECLAAAGRFADARAASAELRQRFPAAAGPNAAAERALRSAPADEASPAPDR